MIWAIREAWQKKVDSAGNAMPDNFYEMESLSCDSLKTAGLLGRIDSLVMMDSIHRLAKPQP
ncbi:MAG: hypothetical protein ABIX01_00820 [Chitinophagaceae bacterium]